MGPDVQEATPLVYSGMMYIPNSGDYIQAIEPQTGDALGVQAPVRTGKLRRRHQPRDRDLGHDADRRERGQHDVRDRRAHRQARLGNEGPRTQTARSHLGPDRRQRQGHPGPPMPAGRPRFVRHHGARREDRQGALAHAHDPAQGRARRRDLGRRANGAALARRHMDGAELRPRART